MYLEPQWGFFLLKLTYCWRTRVFFNLTFQFFEENYLKKKNSVILPVYSLFCDISNATDM